MGIGRSRKRSLPGKGGGSELIGFGFGDVHQRAKAVVAPAVQHACTSRSSDPMAIKHETQCKENADIRCRENRVLEFHGGPFRRGNLQAQNNMLRIIWWQNLFKCLTKK